MTAYGGYFVSGSLHAGVSIPFYEAAGLSGAYTEAAPLYEDDKTTNRTGVFATYYGASGSVSAGIPTPISGNAEVAVTLYDLVEGSRQKYAAPTWDKNNFIVRTSVAMQMANEMRMLAKLNPISQALLPLALIELGGFVNNP